jgi:hypothetical protein
VNPDFFSVSPQFNASVFFMKHNICKVIAGLGCKHVNYYELNHVKHTNGAVNNIRHRTCKAQCKKKKTNMQKQRQQINITLTSPFWLK